ncbi:MarR family transcriptional regulator [Oceanobacillus caeni]|uniref:MarR family winged helix-turn-helix transcriptional regulator n=1 Tax=Oceanobacillus TaxID=182709 RepID=UPI000621D543|nr:MarR family transcriptional regulator [Oceanobacillus caeni]KKE79914.1 transcriptional regulator [Bacilli bacterium VT-13-104]PZD84091.1 MarR family transcriptional regulator [Bacilli bacterium]MCR1835725.1 MarR family transcriptional regulator [Oceanobacillus caeni]PZD85452.1 MarR family transcriptional regulator [Bacilli bacterium]PZD88226.1 MarR family transcriptional regulator [Bacilli bacterium]
MSENLSLKAFVVLLKANKTLAELIKKDISSHGMRTSDFTVLEALYHKGQQTIKQITQSVLINTGSITYVIDKLEKKGLLERTPCKDDRRVVYIQLTDQGIKLMEEIFPLHQQVIENVFEGVTDEEKKIVIDVLKRVGKKSEQLK